MKCVRILISTLKSFYETCLKFLNERQDIIKPIFKATLCYGTISTLQISVQELQELRKHKLPLSQDLFHRLVEQININKSKYESQGDNY